MAGQHGVSLDLEAIQADSAWLRRLAASLASSDAEDAVQDTWEAALSRPLQRPGQLRGWLRVVLRNGLRKSHYQRGARTPVPRFVAPATVDTIVPALRRPPPRLATSTGTDGLANRLSYVPPNWEEIKRRVRENMNVVHEKADTCLQKWTTTDPTLEAGVMLGIEVDARGLMNVWIGDRIDVPSGQLACVSNAVYELDWSGLTDDPKTITVPIRAARGDQSTR